MSLSADVYHTQLDSSYSASLDPVTQITSYYASGTQVSQGIEAEGNFALGGGFSAYLNGTLGSLKYADGPSSGQWVAGAPRDTEALGLNFQRGGWSANASVSRVGRLYNDFKSTHMAYLIEPVLLTNLFVNYSVKNPVGSARLLKVQVGVDNLLNKHSIVGIATPTAVTPSATDLLTVLPARSVNVTATLDF
jgi:iron complex outermembrane receptor protein